MSLDKYTELNKNIANYVSAIYKNGNVRDLQNSFGEGGLLFSSLNKLNSNLYTLNNLPIFSQTDEIQKEMQEIKRIQRNLEGLKSDSKKSLGFFGLQKTIDEFTQSIVSGEDKKQSFFYTFFKAIGGLFTIKDKTKIERSNKPLSESIDKLNFSPENPKLAEQSIISPALERGTVPEQIIQLDRRASAEINKDVPSVAKQESSLRSGIQVKAQLDSAQRLQGAMENIIQPISVKQEASNGIDSAAQGERVEGRRPLPFLSGIEKRRDAEPTQTNNPEQTSQVYREQNKEANSQLSSNSRLADMLALRKKGLALTYEEDDVEHEEDKKVSVASAIQRDMENSKKPPISLNQPPENRASFTSQSEASETLSSGQVEKNVSC